MGTDKARLVLGGVTLVARAAACLAEVTPRVLLASGSAPRYPELGLECVLDGEAGIGPLAGLAAVLARLAREHVAFACVLACDMPRMRPEVFRTLLARARAERAAVALPDNRSGEEPLCAVYQVGALAAVRAALAHGERRMNSFHSAVPVARCADIDPEWLRNVNTLDEYHALGGGPA
jgi:molybdopterin-guanine dinucleotide biosynthesis protein A